MNELYDEGSPTVSQYPYGISKLQGEFGCMQLHDEAFSVVCFRREGADEENEALLERVNATGEIFISHTRLDGRYVLRLAIGNARTTEEDVRRAWDVLNREAAR